MPTTSTWEVMAILVCSGRNEVQSSRKFEFEFETPSSCRAVPKGHVWRKMGGTISEYWCEDQRLSR